MSTNDAIILNEVLAQRRAQEAPAIAESDYFEIFTTNQILKDYELTYEEIEAGLVDGGGDGGIDGIYLFVNGNLVQDDTDLHPYKRNVHLELFFIQAKTTASFGEAAMLKFEAATEELLDLASPLKKLATVYNAGTLAAIGRFRDTYKALAGRFPILSISYIYASKGSEVHPNVNRKVESLKKRLRASKVRLILSLSS
jgi:hypothetical protein